MSVSFVSRFLRFLDGVKNFYFIYDITYFYFLIIYKIKDSIIY
jgi:hypothetical protein